MTGYRPKPRGQNRAKLLTAGMELFQRQGFAATGVQEIADLAGVPKGSFYNYFDSKDAFGVAVVEDYASATCGMLHESLGEDDRSPLERLKDHLDGALSHFDEGEGKTGCLVGNLAQEMASQSPEFQKALDSAFGCMQKHFVDCLGEAQQAGEIADHWNVQELGEYFFNGMHGAVLRAKATGDQRPLLLFRDMTFQHLLA